MKSVASSLIRRFALGLTARPSRRSTRRRVFRPRLSRLENRNMLAVDYLMVTDVQVHEGDGYAEFLVVPIGTVDDELPVSVDYSIASGSASAGSDVVAASGTLSFTSSDSYKIVTVGILDDTSTEDDEEFYLELANAVNASIFNSGRGTILANDRPPVLSEIGDRTVGEETELSFAADAYDPDTPAENLTFSLDSGSPSGASIDSATGAFAWTPTEADGPGTFSVTVRVTEGGGAGLSAAETITITVLEVNRTPEAQAMADVMVLEDAAPTTIDLYAAFEDAEDDDSAMSYAVVDNSDSSLFGSAIINGGSLVLSYAQNAFGSAWITVRATDSLGASVDTSFLVEIVAVNDAPVISGFSAIAHPNSVWEFIGTVTDVDSDLAGSTVVLGGALSGYSALIDYDGSFSLIETLPGYSGTATASCTDPLGANSNVANCTI